MLSGLGDDLAAGPKGSDCGREMEPHDDISRFAAPSACTSSVATPRPTPQGLDTPLASDSNIQGNVLAGFNKDHQGLLFLQFADRPTAQTWLAAVRPRLASNDAVTSFNRRFSVARRQSGSDPADLAAVWLNLSFTAPGLQLLAPDSIASLAQHQSAGTLDPGVALWLTPSFDAGLAGQVGDTGDSAPTDWFFGGPDHPIHAIMCVAADRRSDLDLELGSTTWSRRDPRSADHLRAGRGHA